MVSTEYFSGYRLSIIWYPWVLDWETLVDSCMESCCCSTIHQKNNKVKMVTGAVCLVTDMAML